jgi:DNA topoisomerase-1
MSNLIVTEKNSVAKSIADYLGGYVLKSTPGTRIYYNKLTGDQILPLSGHFVSYSFQKKANNWSRISGAILMDYPILEQISETVRTTIKFCVKTVNRLILATDDDDQGEKIAHDTVKLVEQYKPGLEILRLRLMSLSPAGLSLSYEGIQKKYNKPLALSTEARHKMDLLWGYALTRDVTLKFWKERNIRFSKNIYSVGRVQSPLLKLIADRCTQIKQHQPKEYRVVSFKWMGLSFSMRNSVKQAISSEKVKEITNLLNTSLIRLKTKNKKIVVKPPVLMNTTQLLSCSTRLNKSIKEVSELAQSLYLSGHITYPRTDNVYFTTKTPYLEVFKNLKDSGFADDITVPVYREKILEKADHQAIMPTEKILDVSSVPTSASTRLYRIIVESFLNSLRPETVYTNHTLSVNLCGVEFTSDYNTMDSAGWFIPPRILEKILKTPDFYAEEIHSELKWTQPPALLSQELLVNLLEKLQIGTKSTRSSLIQLLNRRGYTRDFRPNITTKGQDLIDFLERTAPLALSASFSTQVRNSIRTISDETTLEQVLLLFRNDIRKLCTNFI